MLESLYKNIVCDPVMPEPGSIVKIDLWGEFIKSSCHTGVYVGNNQIVEMTNDNGIGTINKFSANQFLNYSAHRTGVYIYVAAIKIGKKYVPLADKKIAERALDAVGNKTKYNLFIDNCHLFTEYCITGSHKSLIGTLESVENTLIKQVASNYKGGTIGDSVYEALRDLKNSLIVRKTSALIPSRKDIWRSTGIGSGNSFPPEKTCWRCGGTKEILKSNTACHCDLCWDGTIDLSKVKLKLTEKAEKYPKERCWRCDGYGIITKHTNSPRECNICKGKGII